MVYKRRGRASRSLVHPATVSTIVRGAQQLYRRARSVGMSSMGRPSLKRRRLSTRKPSVRGRGRMRGNYRGYFKKPKKPSMSAYFKRGTVFTIEEGDVQNSADCAYVGHGFANFRLMQAGVQAFVRYLMEKVGISIVSMSDRVQGNNGGAGWGVSGGALTISYRTDPGGPLQEYVRTVVANETFQDMCDAITIVFFYGIATTADGFEMLEASFSTDPAVSHENRVSLCGFTVHFLCDSWLTLQNRTQSVSGGAADETSALDVANNPLEGKVYGGYGNGPSVRFMDNSVAVDNLIANPTSGVIQFNPTGVGISTKVQANLIRPPSVSALLYCSKASRVRLGPGVLKKGHIQMKRSLNFNKFIRMFRAVLNQTTSTVVRVPFGKYQLYSMEKMCNTRVSEPDIALGFELNQTYRAYCTKSSMGIVSRHIIL